MEARKEQILLTIIKEYIKTATPVGSGVLVQKYRLKVSPATVRNEMAELENEGYIAQPHTSAGRIPTEKAYKLYLQKIAKGDRPAAGKHTPKDLKELAGAVAGHNEESFKSAAKILSNLTGNAVFWAFHRHNIYYTGISNLFQQPEFSQIDLVYDVSSIIDKIDEVINRIFNDFTIGEQVLVGCDNPFGNFCSTVLAKYRLDEHTGMVGIIGLMRMNYEKNIGLIRFINDKLIKS